ncbi:hypothetical protein [Mucilaginibacter sp.]|uniref:hypothetical protein n=1 Tax=Mucilaginibacter sp. TaxID=1882438 RepID=UPI00284E638E|nr:hypothetical protein [Mucilaginibacter sp.]MDR3694393.1 hypothetical protein [Mucilaginibacter sp.]
MSLHVFAIVLSLLLLIYHQVTTWVPLFPWNDVKQYSRKELLAEAGTNGILMANGTLCIVFGNTGFHHYYPLIYYPFLLSGEFFQWWLPHFSAKFAASKVNFDYERLFGRTTKLIPHKPGKRTPDANHIVLHTITVITVIVVCLDRFNL